MYFEKKYVVKNVLFTLCCILKPNSKDLYAGCEKIKKYIYEVLKELFFSLGAWMAQ